MIRGKIEKKVYSSILGGFFGGISWYYWFENNYIFIGIILGIIIHYLMIRKQ